MAGSGCAWGAEPPRFLEAFGRLWQVQSRLGSGSSASVYRVRCCGTPGSPPGALKQFLPPGASGAAASAAEYGFRKERAALEQLQGHRNIGNGRGRRRAPAGTSPVLAGRAVVRGPSPLHGRAHGTAPGTWDAALTARCDSSQGFSGSGEGTRCFTGAPRMGGWRTLCALGRVQASGTI